MLPERHRAQNVFCTSTTGHFCPRLRLLFVSLLPRGRSSRRFRASERMKPRPKFSVVAPVRLTQQSCSEPSRRLTLKEQKRKDKATSVANRIALLPVSLKMRAALCATVFSPIAAWACLLNGRVPDAAERDMCHDCMQPIAPHTKHVLWDCVAHAHLRTVSAPASALAQRLGGGLKTRQ